MDLEKSRVHPDFIAAFLMIAIAISEVYTRRDYLNDIFTNFNIWDYDLFQLSILSAVGAIILLTTKHGSIVKTLVVSTLIFASMSVTTALVDILTLSQYLNYDLENFMLGVVTLALGLILIGNIIVYWTKASASLYLAFYGMGGILCMHIIQQLTYYRYGMYLDELLIYSILPDLPMILLILFTMMLLRSDSVRTYTMLYEIDESAKDIRSVMPIGLRLERSEISKIMDLGEKELWCDSCEIPVRTFYPGAYRMVMTRTDGKTSVLVSPSSDGTGMGICRFLLKGVWTDTGDAGTCSLVRLYDEDSFFIQLIAEDDTPDEQPVSIKERLKSLREKAPVEEEISE